MTTQKSCVSTIFQFSTISHKVLSKYVQYEALRRVHLIPSDTDSDDETLTTVNANVFRDLEFSVSEGGENFSTG